VENISQEQNILVEEKQEEAMVIPEAETINTPVQENPIVTKEDTSLES
jgi:hypothetical protein